MPRPKVAPDKRLRAAEACTYCQSTKKRCSGIVPCNNCSRKGKAHQCTLAKGRPVGHTPAAKAATQRPRPRTPVNLQAAPVDPLLSNASLSPSATNSTVQTRHSIAGGIPSPDASHKTQPRILQGAQGERVYIGGSASLSFLQFIRDTVSQYVGPSPFSNDTRIGTMHEDTSVQTPLSPFMEDNLSSEQKLELVDVYLMATSGLVDVLARAEATQLIRDQSRSEIMNNTCKSAMADLVLAIGAQCSRPDPSLIEVEKFYFNRGQQRAFSTMLRNPSIEMIAVFLLMSFYMLGACHRNAASMYLGVASRAATVLGLQHQESYLSVTEKERQQQLRTWMSLRILDLLVSAILARPSSAPAAGSSDNLFTLFESELEDRKDLIAQYKLVKIVDQIVDNVYGQKGVSPATAEAFLDQLKKWSDALPEGLQSQGMMADPKNPAKSLSSLHLACTYYFAVTLATRPFLITTLTARMARLSNNNNLHSFSVQEHPVHAELASVCVDSAVWLIRACLEAQRSGLLLANMQIMKALVFAAALILGFSLFAQLQVDLETDAMFAGARDILASFSARSSQAAHYHDILTSLTQTIHRQRQQFAMQSRRRSNAYVGQLFKTAEPETPQPVPQQGQDQSGQLEPTLVDEGADDINSLINTACFSDLDMWMQSQPIFNNMPEEADILGADLLGWDSLDLGLWDNFPYMNQPAM
ncbi:hypothetical protein KVT40_002479 [Elsinoe batatas]|uniref:Zn(2)-C6 fungal-type domain-containing protein n=1 Tax=Elsinoe batatas TaxID=2601811 RepID=A0A8K0L8R0_9PEZI|nr:hypothetical protein KVT40_002479 [Elsinoe batatas]